MSAAHATSESLHYSCETDRLSDLYRVLGPSRLTQPLATCIPPLLVALDWLGRPKSILDSLPPDDQPLLLADLQTLLKGLGFETRLRGWEPEKALTTATLLERDGLFLVYLGCYEGRSCWHDGREMFFDFEPKQGDVLLLVRKAAEFQSVDSPQPGWLSKLALMARREVAGILTLSLTLNLLTLAVSLFTMFVYNSVIPTGASNTLIAITLGAVIAVLGGWVLRLARAKVMARMMAWAGAKIGAKAFSKTLGLPLEASIRGSMDNHFSRLRSLESVRQWFGGAGGAVSVDYPFALIFLLVIGVLGGWIVVVPLLSLLLFVVLSRPMALYIESRSRRVGVATRQLNELVLSLVQHLRGLNGVADSALWHKRIAELVVESAEANRDYAMATGFAQTLAAALGSLTVLATMSVGVMQVLQQAMSSGGLIATMMLIWRVTIPAQQMFSNQVRVRQMLDATRQLDRLLQTAGEMVTSLNVAPVSLLKNDIQLDKLYYRYGQDREAALTGISLLIPAGQFMAVVGPNGSGKSTLLELLAGLRFPQSGRVLVGGRDVRQLDLGEYRARIGYLPQKINGLKISVRETLLLRDPVVSDAQMHDAMARIAGERWWRLFDAQTPEQALQKVITPWSETSDDVRNRMIVRFAAAIIDNPPILLLDDPVNDRDPLLEACLLRLLSRVRGHCTLVLATHNPALIALADQVAILSEGGLAHVGPVASQASQSHPVSTQVVCA